MKAILKNLMAACSLILLVSLSLEGQIKFQDATQKAGLIEPLRGMKGHGAAWGDVTGNGYPDLFYGTFAIYSNSEWDVRGHTGGASPNKLLLNNGDGTFTEVMESPIRVKSWNSGAAFADFDNDGDLDLVISHQHHVDIPYGKLGNFLFENDGMGNFTDVTAASNLYFEAPFLGRSTMVFDYDGDGLLDVFMQEDWVLADKGGSNSRLMKNMGDLVFKDVTAEAGFPHGFREGLYGLGGFAADINGDDWPDIFFAHSCRMFINNRNGTFHEKEYDLVDPKTREPATVNPDWTCGADLGDLDNDGDMDFVIGDHLDYRDSANHHIYIILNEGNDEHGDPVFRDITFEAGIEKSDIRAPHIELQDIDNDGMIDIMTAVCDQFIYRNRGVVDSIPRFEDPVGTGFVGGIGYWAAGPLGDYDRDGRLDFIGPDWEPAFASPLLRNVSKSAKHYIAVKPALRDGPNRNGIGARVEIYKAGMLGEKEGLLGTRIISVSNGYSSGTEAIAYFGVPDSKTVDILMTMPAGGKVYTRKGVKRKQMVIISE
jgi:hypothetical protein